jgi:hypothetical protein
MLAVVFQFLTQDAARLAVAFAAGLATLAITLMARRAYQYTAVLEDYTAELEQRLGFGLIATSRERMPKGLDSTRYLFFVYWGFVSLWSGLAIHYTLRLCGAYGAAL